MAIHNLQELRRRNQRTIYTAFYDPDLRTTLQEFAAENNLFIQDYQGMMDLWTEPGLVAVIDRAYFGPEDWDDMINLMGSYEQPPCILLGDRDDLPLPDHWEVYQVPDEARNEKIIKIIHRVFQEKKRHALQREAAYAEIDALLCRGHFFHSSFIKDGPVDRRSYESQGLKLLWILDSLPDPRSNKSDLPEYIRDVLPHQLETNKVNNEIWNRILQVTMGITETHLRQDPKDPVSFEEAAKLAEQQIDELNCISLRKLAIVNADKTGTGQGAPEILQKHIHDFTKLTCLQLVSYQPDIVIGGPKAQPVIEERLRYDNSYSEINITTDNLSVSLGTALQNQNQLLCQAGAPDSTMLSQKEYYTGILHCVIDYLREYRW